MPDSNAYRPGDIWGSLDGKTVEIVNTDAEGRLVLADALAYARALTPDLIVDNATLTGACVVALGSTCSGWYAPDASVAREFDRAVAESGEQMWRMPLLEELREQIKSEVADVKQAGDRWGGSITAALFLREFVADTKWIHCDIAGPASNRSAPRRYGCRRRARPATACLRSWRSSSEPPSSHMEALESDGSVAPWRAITDFGLIADGDRILVAVSGGKDSYTMLHLLRDLQRRAPVNFALKVVNVDQGHPGYPAHLLREYMAREGHDFTMIEERHFLHRHREDHGGGRRIARSARACVAEVLYRVATGVRLHRGPGARSPPRRRSADAPAQSPVRRAAGIDAAQARGRPGSARRRPPASSCCAEEDVRRVFRG